MRERRQGRSVVLGGGHKTGHSRAKALFVQPRTGREQGRLPRPAIYFFIFIFCIFFR